MKFQNYIIGFKPSNIIKGNEKEFLFDIRHSSNRIIFDIF